MTSKPRGSNSFVSPGAKFEFEFDIVDISGKTRTGNNSYGLVAIDNFTTFAKVVPINNRQPAELIRGLKLTFQDMGTPNQLYSDEESSFRASAFFRFMNELNIKHLQTSTHAHTVERFIRTCLDNLYRRLDALHQEKSDCIKHIEHIVVKHNNTEHSTIKIKPNEALKQENHLWANWHLQNNAKQYRTYPKINEGDMVRVHIKKNKFDKGHQPNWSKTIYRVVDIINYYFYIPNINNTKLSLIHELSKT